MTDLQNGEVWFDPHCECEIIVREDIQTAGMKVHEMDRISVPIEYPDGEVHHVPHERFRGRRTYEFRRKPGVEA